MCAVKSPKIVSTPAEQAPPKPVVIRNSYLDGNPAAAASRRGRSQLRIDPGSPKRSTAPASIRIPTAAPASARPAPNLNPNTDAFGRPLNFGGRIIKQAFMSRHANG